MDEVPKVGSTFGFGRKVRRGPVAEVASDDERFCEEIAASVADFLREVDEMEEHAGEGDVPCLPVVSMLRKCETMVTIVLARWQQAAARARLATFQRDVLAEHAWVEGRCIRCRGEGLANSVRCSACAGRGAFPEALAAIEQAGLSSSFGSRLAPPPTDYEIAEIFLELQDTIAELPRVELMLVLGVVRRAAARVRG